MKRRRRQLLDRQLTAMTLALCPSIEAPEPVNHPRHYNEHPSGVECITIAEHFNFNLGNALKYIWRAGLKGALVEDLKKARFYVDREIQRLEGKCVVATEAPAARAAALDVLVDATGTKTRSTPARSR